MQVVGGRFLRQSHSERRDGRERITGEKEGVPGAMMRDEKEEMTGYNDCL